MMQSIFSNKLLKPKEKTEQLCGLISNHSVSIDELISFANASKDPIKATCIEAIEYVTKSNPSIANKVVFEFAISNLSAKAPRLKWESAKVIANTASLFPDLIESAINALLKNTEHEGTVVRWSAALALSEIYKLNAKFNKDLYTIFDGIVEREEKNSIKKIYLSAIK